MIPTCRAAIPWLTTAQMIEDYAIELIQMMENAGRNLAHLARERFLGGDPRGKRVVVLAGTVPEIYLMVARQLGVAASHCLVIEDSPIGGQAALAAGMHCIAVTTPFTREAFHKQPLLPADQIVDEPTQLFGVVDRILKLPAAT